MAKNFSSPPRPSAGPSGGPSDAPPHRDTPARPQKSVFLPPSAYTARFSVAGTRGSYEDSDDSCCSDCSDEEFSIALSPTRPRAHALSETLKEPENQPNKLKPAKTSPKIVSSSLSPLSPVGISLALRLSGAASPVRSPAEENIEKLENSLKTLGSEKNQPFLSSESPLIRLENLRGFSSTGLSEASPLAAQWAAVEASKLPVDLLKASKVIQSMLSCGIPASIRPQVWLKFSGASAERDRFPSDYYDRLCQIFLSHGSAFDEEIEKDVRRTMPSLKIFQVENSPAARALARVLACYCLRNSLTGYCQGMNTLAGFLLTIMTESEAFWVLTCIVEQRSGYYTRSMCGLEVDLRTFHSLIQFALPALAALLTKFEIGVESFSVSWFVCLFCEAPLKLLDCVRFWDYLLLWGDEALFQLAIALLRAKEKVLLKKQEAVEILDYLLHNGLMDGVDVPALMKTLVPGRFSSEVALLREFHKGEVVKLARQLNPNTARRLAGQYKFTDAAEVQDLWESFLEPAPWQVLLHSSLQSPLRFCQAIRTRAFSDSHRAKWLDSGLLSGVFDRLFSAVDRGNNSFISFEQFLGVSRVFLHGSVADRLNLAFRFYDENGDDRVSYKELSEGFERLHKLYNGLGETGEALEVSKLFAQMIFDRCLITQEEIENKQQNEEEQWDEERILMQPIDSRGLSFLHFRSLITLHPFSLIFFQLPEQSGGFL